MPASCLPRSDRKLSLAVRSAFLSLAFGTSAPLAWAASAPVTDPAPSTTDTRTTDSSSATSPAASPALTLPAVTIQASRVDPDALPETYTGGQVARGARFGLLGNKDLMDVPFSVSSYTAKMAQDQQALTVADVLERDSSVRSTGQQGGIVDSFFIRGFPVGEGNLGELAFDGVYGVAPNYRVFTEYAERIEVLKGPGALLYGLSPNSGVGGVINIVPKRSLDQDLTRLTATYATDAQFGEHIDLSRRFGDQRQFGIRINGSTQQGDTSIDKQSRDVDIGSVSLDYRGEQLRTSLDLINQKEKIDAPSRPFVIVPGIDVPSAANGSKNVTQDWTWSKTREKSALLSGEYDLSDALTVFAHAGGGRSDVSRLSDQTPQIIDNAGDTRSTPGYYKFSVQRYTVDAGLRGHFDTGPITHNTTLQVTRYRDELSRGINTGTPVLSNIYDPVDSPEQFIAAPDVAKVSQTQLSGVALADTLAMLDERLQVTLGLRKQNIESDNYNAGVLTTDYEKSATTPLFGVVIKPWDHVSFYYNYLEGLSKGDIAPGTASNSGQIFAPYISRQQEVGMKVDYGTFTSTLSLFQIKKPSGELDPDGVYSVSGEQRNRGVELNLFGQVAPTVRLLGGVTLLDAELVKTDTQANRGNKAVGVPDVQANVWAEWDTPWIQGVTLTSGAIYTSRQYIDQANTQQLDPWTRFDLGARYSTRIVGRPTTFRADVQNVFNHDYWSGVASYGAFSQGAPRTLQLSASVDF